MKRSSDGRSSRWGNSNSSKSNKKFKDKNSDDRSSSSHYGPAAAAAAAVTAGVNRVVEEDDDEYCRHNLTNNNNERSTNYDVYHVDSDDRRKGSSTKEEGEEEKAQEEPEYKPNFGLSGALAKETLSYKGVQLKFSEPPEARAPNTQWRFYVFKRGHDDVIETLHISKQSAYLLGRNVDIADIPLLHPSLSGQHAVLQYRAMPIKIKESEAAHNEKPRLSCQPYIMDLESTNGTFLNSVKLDPARYYQLRKGDVLTFGASTREYVLMTENTTST